MPADGRNESRPHDRPDDVHADPPAVVWLLRIGLLQRALPFMRAEHILQFDFIHYVRWTIVDGLHGEKLRYRYLFFESNFDGPWQHYIDAFAYVIPKEIRLTWGRGPSLPRPAAGRAAEGVDRDEQHGGRPLLLRLSAGEHARWSRARWSVRERFERLVADAGTTRRRRSSRPRYERFLTESQAQL